MSPFVEIAIDIIVYIGIGGSVCFSSLCMYLIRCSHRQKKIILDQGQMIQRQSKAILLMAKGIDRFTNQIHQGSNSDLYEEARIALQDENKKL